ncbi:actin-related protein 8 isoform X1 [Drosophila gunungcola]|uniref:actin-related protein 8 isoform X1 n=1 Tax=Drosophila gunungcola TaxID=103775 RepID=UPI0022E8FA97|nr:actin-related protein 8 isoform X1 [Drosophila gunungcola]
MPNPANRSRRRSRASSTSSGRQPAPPPTGLPQPQAQPLEAPKIIVIHPGSQHLRIGRAADLNPITLLHAVAYKRRQVDGDWPHHDALLPPLDNINPAQLQVEFEAQRLAVSSILQHCVVDEKNRLRVATPPQQLANFNRSSPAEKVPPPSGQPPEDQLPWLDREAPVLFDDRILRLSAFDARDYDIHFPIQRGELNVHKEKGGSLQASLQHLERIWAYALEARLKIPLRDLGTHCAVLVVNDVYVRRHLREFMTLLLQRLGFRRCFLVQDSVASTYGAGIGYGCVVDIGAQKTSIACIEDGISQLDARVRLPYGGGDLNQVLLMLLRKCGFPYRECNVQDSYVDAHLLDELKEKFCHLNASVCGAQEKHFTLRKQNGQWLRYTIQVGDEAIMAPLALFHTELLNITGRTRAVCTQQAAQEQYDCEDCFDAEYLKETGRKNGVRGGDTLPLATGPGSLPRPPLPVTADDEELIVVDQDEANSNCQPQQAAQTVGGQSNANGCYHSGQGQVLPLDQAIIRAINRLSSYETKRKMFGSILLVGSSAKLPGLAAWLEHRISQQIQPTGAEVNVFTKGMDAGMVAWKGAAIMSVLESARELWISQHDWQRYGLRILRERSPFLW